MPKTATHTIHLANYVYALILKPYGIHNCCCQQHMRHWGRNILDRGTCRGSRGYPGVREGRIWNLAMPVEINIISLRFLSIPLCLKRYISDLSEPHT